MSATEGISPRRAINTTTIQFSIASIVALTHGSLVAAAEHATHHISTVFVDSINGDKGVAVYLTCRLGILAIIFTLTLASAIDGVADETLGEGDIGIGIDFDLYLI